MAAAGLPGGGLRKVVPPAGRPGFGGAEQVAQRRARAEEMRLDRRHRDAGDLGDLLEREAVEVVEHHRQAVALGERLDGRAHVGRARPPGRVAALLRRRPEGSGGCGSAGSSGSSSGPRTPVDLGADAARGVDVAAEVRRDAQDPVAEGAREVEARERAPGVGEGVLGDVLRQVRVLEHAAREVVDARAVALDEAAERLRGRRRWTARMSRASASSPRGSRWAGAGPGGRGAAER